MSGLYSALLFKRKKAHGFALEKSWKLSAEGVNNFVSLDFLLGRFLPTVINRKPSIYNGSWAPPTPGLWNKVEGQRHKIKNTTYRL